jgi:hypothetical protein
MYILVDIVRTYISLIMLTASYHGEAGPPPAPNAKPWSLFSRDWDGGVESEVESVDDTHRNLWIKTCRIGNFCKSPGCMQSLHHSASHVVTHGQRRALPPAWNRPKNYRVA